MALASDELRGKRFLTSVVDTGAGFPRVVGLVVMFAVSSQGPLGRFDLVFTREAMITSQFVLATPPIAAISLAALTGVDRDLRHAGRATRSTGSDDVTSGG